MAISLTPSQLAARDAAVEALTLGYPFLLAGFAGTGKTTTAIEIIRTLRERGLRVVASAPTHAAKRVLARKLHAAGLAIGAMTTPALLGLTVSTDSGVQRLRQENPSTAHEFHVVLVDEVSMVGRDLQKFITKLCPRAVLYIGDPAQLPPVMEAIAPIFASAVERVELTEIVRQSSVNPLLDAATALRVQQGAPLDWGWARERSAGSVGIFTPSAAAEDEWLRAAFTDPEWDKNPDSFRVLAFKNDTVANYNAKIRRWRYGPTLTPFIAGEQVICRQPVGERVYNEKKKRHVFIPHFTTLEETQVIGIESDVRYLEFDEIDSGWSDDGSFREHVKPWHVSIPIWRVRLKHAALGSIIATMPQDWAAYDRIDARLVSEAIRNKKRWFTRYRLKESMADLRPPYAMTVHCSQGATFDHVFVDFRDLATAPGSALLKQRLAYTAITRPRNSVFLLNAPAITSQAVAA